MRQLELWPTSEDFLLKRAPRIPTGIKIRQGVGVLNGIHIAREGLIRTAEQVSAGGIEDVAISGDFTFYPKKSLGELEKSLEKVPLEEDRIIEAVEACYEKKAIESTGVESKNFAATILNPLKNSKA